MLLHLHLNPYNRWGIISMQTMHFVALSTLLFMQYLKRMEVSILKAARGLGATWWECFYQVILPLLWPVIAVAWILSFMRSLSDFVTPAVIGGNGFLVWCLFFMPSLWHYNIFVFLLWVF